MPQFLVLLGSISLAAIAIFLSGQCCDIWSSPYLIFPASFQTPREHKYTTHIVSIDPFMVYIDGFLTNDEVAHVLGLGSSRYKASLVTSDMDEGRLSDSRTSQTAFLHSNDSTIATIKGRAEDFLGLAEYSIVETIQLTAYSSPNDKIKLHADWFKPPLPRDSEGREYNRMGTFFIYLDASCTAGETWFPNLPAPPPEKGHMYRTTADRRGLAVVPRAGSGIFWANLNVNGSGDIRNKHAGLPVGTGSKVGMNIFVRQYMS